MPEDAAGGPALSSRPRGSVIASLLCPYGGEKARPKGGGKGASSTGKDRSQGPSGKKVVLKPPQASEVPPPRTPPTAPKTPPTPRARVVEKQAAQLSAPGALAPQAPSFLQLLEQVAQQSAGIAQPQGHPGVPQLLWPGASSGYWVPGPPQMLWPGMVPWGTQLMPAQRGGGNQVAMVPVASGSRAMLSPTALAVQKQLLARANANRPAAAP